MSELASSPMRGLHLIELVAETHGVRVGGVWNFIFSRSRGCRISTFSPLDAYKHIKLTSLIPAVP